MRTEQDNLRGRRGRWAAALVLALAAASCGTDRQTAQPISLAEGSPSPGATAESEAVAPPVVAGRTGAAPSVVPAPVPRAVVPSPASVLRRTTLVSVATSGAQGNGDSWDPGISGDGRLVVFASFADNLVAGDTNKALDVFLHDRTTRTTTRVSVARDGTQANGPSAYPRISADGRYVVFGSGASNLVAGQANDASDGPQANVFVRDLASGAVVLVTKGLSAGRHDGSSNPTDISDDGRYVGFWSTATGLVDGDTNKQCDAFVWDRSEETISRVSVSSSGEQANGCSMGPRLSGDGRVAGFASSATNLAAGADGERVRFYVRDLSARTTSLIPPDGWSTTAPGDLSNRPNLLLDRSGAFVAFSNTLPAPESRPNERTGAYLYDRAGSGVQRVSTTMDGRPLRGAGEYDTPQAEVSSITPDGRYVTFWSGAVNLAADDANNDGDVFVFDRAAKRITLVSRTPSGASGGGLASDVSATGAAIAFHSGGKALVSGDANERADIFVSDVV